MFSDNLDHQLEESVDLVLPVAEVTTLNKVVGLLSPSTSWRVQFKWPQEICSIFEVWSNCHYFMYQVFNADNSELS